MRCRVVAQYLCAGFARGRNVAEFAVVPAIGNAHLGGDDVVEEGHQWLHDEVECTSNEHGAMTGGLVFAHSTNRFGERLRKNETAEHLCRILFDLLQRGTVVTAVEEAKEVGAVFAVERKQRWALGDHFPDEAKALISRHASSCKERVTRNDV
ncbi:unannotated protein [freshwater metagenome]|uniref:Unannotated protein n=1 Tax=freshwater metagenome TaxID=449393 RepID=A0A6J6HSV0_9ZZZZ